MRLRLALLPIVSVLALSSSKASAATTCTWQSMSSSSWSVIANWSCGHVPMQTDDVVFPGSPGLQLAVSQDIAGLTAVHNISVTGGAYTFSGNELLIGGGINASSQSGPLFLLPLKLNGAQTFSNTGLGPLTFQTGGIDETQFALTFDAQTEIDVFSVIAGNGNGSVLKTGNGLLSLESANTYNGVTSISSGVVRIKNAQGLGASILSGTTFSGTGSLETNGMFTLAEALTLSADTTINNAGAGLVTLSGKIGGPSKLTVKGGPTVLSGINTFSGGLNVGTLGQLVTSGPTTLGTGPVTVLSGSGLSIDSGTYPNTFSLFGAGPSPSSATLLATSDATFVNGAITVNIGATIDVLDGLSALGGITGPGALSKRGDGALVVSKACSYTGGATLISAGGLFVDKADVLPDDTNVTVLLGGSFHLVDVNETVGSISGAGAIDVGTGTLTFGNAQNQIFSGPISGAGSLVVHGIGTQTLTNKNTYSGGTTVQAGTLRLTGATLASKVDVTGATLTTNAANVGPLTLDSASTFQVHDDTKATVTGAVSLDGKLDVVLASETSVGSTYLVIDNDGADPVTGTFTGLAEGATFASGSTALSISYKGGSGNDVVLTVVDAVVVPDAGAPTDAGVDAEAPAPDAEAPDAAIPPVSDASVIPPSSQDASSSPPPTTSTTSTPDAGTSPTAEPESSDGCTIAHGNSSFLGVLFAGMLVLLGARKRRAH